MSQRTNDTAVRGIIESDSSISTAPFIAAAVTLVDKVAACATAKGKTLTDDQLLNIETWLAAHFYALRDQQYTSRSTAGASGSFQGQTGMMLDLTYWGQMAKLLDTSGCLTQIEKRQTASAHYLGTKRNDAEVSY